LCPFSTCRIRRSTSRGHSKPASFRLQGLVTLVTVCSRRNRASLISCWRRSWDSPFGAFSSAEVATRLRAVRTRLPFFPRAIHLRRSEGPAPQAAASGLWPSIGVPCEVRAINTHNAGCSRGLFPFRAFGADPGRASPAASRALRLRLASMPWAGAPESCESSPDPDRSRF